MALPKYRLIGRNKLIPRPDFPGRQRHWTKGDPDSPFASAGRKVTYADIIIKECVIQPINGKAAKDQTQQLVLEGERQYDAFTVYSTTPLFGASEGSDELSDQILIPNARGVPTWFTVLKSDVHVSAGVSRFKAYVVAVPEDHVGGM